MKIQQLITTDDHGQDNFITVGKYGVTEIIEHSAQGEGDKWYYDVVFGDKINRIFSFKEVVFIKDLPPPQR